MLSVGDWRVMYPARIFVSHTPEDDDFCQDLVGALRNAGADVWVNDQHYALSQLLPVIEPEVRTRPIFIVILSPAALRSGMVAAACTWAATFQRQDATPRFLPVLAEAVDENVLRAFFQSILLVPAMPPANPLPRAEAIQQTLSALALAPTVVPQVVSPQVVPQAEPRALVRGGISDLLARGTMLR